MTCRSEENQGGYCCTARADVLAVFVLDGIGKAGVEIENRHNGQFERAGYIAPEQESIWRVEDKRPWASG